MGNVLEFALGLQTSEFISKLGLAGGELLSFAAVGEAVRKSWEHTWEAINQGAELRGLASATGESVSNLYRFQQGLGAIGGQTESLPMFFMLVQKALSGVNDAGMRTSILFNRLGLDINQLRAEDGVKALTAIAGALGRINSNQSAGIAEQLFGRFQAETVLQMARNMDTFQRGFQGSSQTGALLDKFSKVFEDVKADWQFIESDVLSIWVLVGGKIAPALHKVMVDVDGYIQRWVKFFSNAESMGKFGELFKEAIAAGTERFTNLFVQGDFWAGLAEGLGGAYVVAGAKLMEVFADAQIFFTAGLLKAVDAMHEALAGSELGKLLHMQGYKAPTFNSIYEMVRGTMGPNVMADALAHAGESLVKSGATHMANAWDLAGTGPAQKRLNDLMKTLNGRPITAPDSGAGAGGASIGNLGPSSYKMEFTSLEKMGFVMKGGVGNPFELRKIDLLQQIAQNTSQAGRAAFHPGGLLPTHAL